MANEIRGGGTGIPGQVQTQQPKTLNEKEASKVQQQNVQGKMSAQDAARIAQQAGFQRAQKKTGKGIDLGDSSRSPIPIPDDENDTELWTPERLESAQENLSMAGAQFAEVAQGGVDGPSIGEAVVASSFMPTEQGVEKLQLLADRPAPEPLPMDEVTTNVRAFFNIELGEDVPPGQKMLVTGLVVAGEAGSVEVNDGKVNEQRLAKGLQEVANRSNQAVGEAQKMSKGVSRELNLQRTFVFKR